MSGLALRVSFDARMSELRRPTQRVSDQGRISGMTSLKTPPRPHLCVGGGTGRDDDALRRSVQHRKTSPAQSMERILGYVDCGSIWPSDVPQGYKFAFRGLPAQT
jgi:hypothetical protein